MISNRFVSFNSGLARLRGWWRADQVRVSPGQGRLLRIQPPSLLEVESVKWIVRSRHHGSINDEFLVRYVCEHGVNTNELWVFPPSDEYWQSKILWICGKDRRRLEESSVTVYPLTTKTN